MTALMVQGVSSDAGKSLLVTALCAWARRQGIHAVPFKAQNMSNNARIVDGGEIGNAQWLQALAAGVEPDVRMNPILLKPESETHSQVVVNGTVSEEFTARAWRGRSVGLWPHVTVALGSLAHQFDVVIIEGAGSPAETNLWPDDIANMAVADAADAPVAVVADIDRGGAFAHLYGTWALLPARWQSRIEGFVLNKFRGDPDLLHPAPHDLRVATGVPTVGVLPWLDHGLPDEEGPTLLPGTGRGPSVSIVCAPLASNLDEFAGLQQVAEVSWVRAPGHLGPTDLIILPGSKHVARDLAWLRRTGLSTAVTEAAAHGTAVLGICGGLQMLGHRIEDPAGVEGAAEGLGLLPVETRYRTAKRTTRSSACFGPLGSPWTWLGGRVVTGYEIRHGDHPGVRAGRGPTRRVGIRIGQRDGALPARGIRGPGGAGGVHRRGTPAPQRHLRSAGRGRRPAPRHRMDPPPHDAGGVDVAGPRASIETVEVDGAPDPDVLPITLLGNPILRRRCPEVTDFGRELAALGRRDVRIHVRHRVRCRSVRQPGRPDRAGVRVRLPRRNGRSRGQPGGPGVGPRVATRGRSLPLAARPRLADHPPVTLCRQRHGPEREPGRVRRGGAGGPVLPA